MKTKMFAYKGNIGAESDIENGKFINNPKGGGQLGIVIDIKEVEITQEVVDILKSASRDGGSFASIMLTKHSDEAVGTGGSVASIGLMGFGKHFFPKSEIAIGRTCDKEILDLCTISEIETPQDFKDFVDGL